MLDQEKYNRIIERVIWNEKGNTSGYVNDPDDPGGETFCGISRNNHPFWEGWGIIDILKEYKDFKKHLYRNKKLMDMVYEFYYESYYKGSIESIVDERIAFLALDFKIHSGGNGIKSLQIAVNRIYKQSILLVDGVIGAHSLKELNSISLKSELEIINFCRTALDVRSGFFINCKRSWKYLNNWVKRMNNNEKYIMES